MSREWRCLQVGINQERRVENALRQENLRTWLPLQKVEQTRNGITIKKLRPLLTSYLFVCFDAKRDPWQTILRIVGVRCFLGFQNKESAPLAIPSYEIKLLRARLKELGTVERSSSTPPVISAGTMVTILFGPFCDKSAEVQADLGTRVEVMLRLLGRETHMKLNKVAIAA